MATEKQVAFMQKLAEERVATNFNGQADPEGRTVAQVLALAFPEDRGGVEGYWAHMLTLSVGEVSEKIDRLMKAPKAGGNGGGSTRSGNGAPLPQVPAGHYAVESATGNNDLDFYRVDRPEKGRWEGYTFVKRVIGGQADSPVRGGEAKDALARIEAAGVEAAAVRYGQEIGRCYRCNRHLTDETSRELGIGPECRRIVGAA